MEQADRQRLKMTFTVNCEIAAVFSVKHTRGGAAGARGGVTRGTGSGVFDVDSDSTSLIVNSPSSEATSSPLSDPDTSNASSPPSEDSSGEDGKGSSSWEDCAASPLGADAKRSATDAPGAALEFNGTIVGG